MVFVACPECGTFNPPATRQCTECKAAIPEEPAPAPPPVIAVTPALRPPPPAAEPAKPAPAPARSPRPMPSGGPRPAPVAPAPRPLLDTSPERRLPMRTAFAIPVAMIALAAAWYALRPRPVPVARGDFYAEAPRWSPDGRRIAFVVGRQEDWNRADLAVYDLAAKTHRVIAALDRSDGEPFSWSPDGRQVAFTFDGQVMLVDAGGGAARPLAPGGAARFTSDGSALIAHCDPQIENQSGYFCRIDVATGAIEAFPVNAFVPGDVSVLHLLELDPRSSAAEDINVVDLVTAETRHLVRITPRTDTGGLRVRWPPRWTEDGTRVLYCSGSDVWAIAPDGTQRELLVRSVPGVDLATVTTAPDGKWVYFSAAVPGASEEVSKAIAGELPGDLYAVPIGTDKIRRYENDHPFKRRFRLSPDGRHIVYERRRPHANTTSVFWGELWLLKT